MRLFFFLALAACSDTAPTARSGTDISSLERMLTLPVRPLGVKWQHAPMGTPGGLGPTDYQLDAQLWLSAEELKSFHLHELEDGSGYDPSPFFKAPFLHGTLRRENNELILHLTTM